MNILLVGSCGKMGQKVMSCAKDMGVNIVCSVDVQDCSSEQTCRSFKDIKESDLKKIDIVLDFSSYKALNDILLFCLKNKKPLVICSTGHSKKQEDQIEKASKIIPIFKTTNTCFGVALINKIIKQNINEFLEYDVFVLEKHHKNKKDSPSGTALTFMENLQKDKSSVNYASVRGGSVVGEHEIMLMGDGEQISIKHVAEDRKLFAYGALKICKFIKDLKPGKLYLMEDLFR